MPIPSPSLVALASSGGGSAFPRRSVLAGMAAIAAGTLATPPARAESAGGVCTFGVFPYLPVLKLERLFAPVAVEFARILGTDVQLKSKETFEAFTEELRHGRYDIVLVHPFLFVEASAGQGYLPSMRVSGDLRAVLLAREPGKVQSLEAYRGHTLALPPKLSAVSYLIAAALIDGGLRPNADVMLRHYPDKVSCLHAVATNEVAACAVPSFIVGQLPAIAQMELHPVWQSAPVTNLVFALHPKMPAGARTRLATAMASWPSTAKGRALLAHLEWPGLVPAADADFAAIRALGNRLSAYAAR